jgi:hypothetical protein
MRHRERQRDRKKETERKVISIKTNKLIDDL